jgi:hypothetical protein
MSAIPETIDTPCTHLSEGDELLGRDRVTRFLVLATQEIDRVSVRLTVREVGTKDEPTTYVSSLAHGPVRLISRRCASCDGSGQYVQGPIVNGVPARTGVCFGCHGAKRQSVADIHRCRTYWNKHARIRA